MSRLSITSLVVLLVTAASVAALPPDLAWRYPTGGRIRSQPAVDRAGAVYALSDDGSLYAFSPAGRVRWAASLGALVTDSLTLGRDGTAYAGLTTNEIKAVNPAGEVIWSFDAGGTLLGNPVTARDGTLFVGTRSGRLSVVSVSGRLEWSITLPAAMTAPPVLDGNGTLYLAGADRRLYALTRWGRFEWSLPLPGVPEAAAVGGSGAVYLLTRNRLLVKVAPAGEVNWTHPVGAGAFGPLIGPRALFVATQSGTVSAFSPSGRLLWQKRTEPLLTGAWVLGGEALFLMTTGKELVALRPSDGSALGTTRLEAAGPLALGPAGTLLVGGRDWVVYAYRRVAADPQAPWAQPSADSEHSGRSGRPVRPSTADRALARIPAYLALNVRFDPASHGSLGTLLDDIGAQVSEGSAGKGTWYLRHLLERMVGVGTVNPVVSGSRVINDFPMIRARAARLLGQLSSLGARTALIGALSEEDDGVAATAEIAALGAIGSDRDGAATRAIAQAVDSFPSSSGEGDRVADAAITALRRITQYEGRMPDPAGSAVLRSIFHGNYPDATRQAALALLWKQQP